MPPARRTILLSVVVAGVARVALADGAAVDRALALVPDDAVSFVVIPSLKSMSDDIAQIVEATGQGGLLSMGRPIDLLKAQFGVGANLDEKGPAVAYFPKAQGERPVLVLPVTDGEAFIKANLTAAPDKGEGAFTIANGDTVFARAFPGSVVLAPQQASLPAELPARGMAERFRGRLKPMELAWLERADVVAWGSRDALHAAVERARAAPIPEEFAGGIGGDPAEARKRGLDIADMLADGVVVLDIDPLGIYLATLGVAEPSSTLASVMAGGEGRQARFDRLPQAPFYIAASVDLDGLGGVAKAGELMDLAGVPRTTLPDWFFTEGSSVRAVQFAAYPSKLGVAVGGALNDSACFIASRNPDETLARWRASVESQSGESEGIRREAAWIADKKLKSGESVTAFEVKDTVVDASKRPVLDYERIARQFTFGVRGLNGLVKRRDDGLVAVFSQRPDVYSRALEAAAGAKCLAFDATVKSIEEWLPEQRDVEVMIGVGPLVNLVAQIATSFVGEERVKSMLPQIGVDAPPVALALEVGDARARAVVVVPAEVVKAMSQLAGSRLTAPQAPPAPGEAKP